MTNQTKQNNLEISAIYICALAIDLLLRDSERRLKDGGQGWKHEKKQAFKRYLQHVRNACLEHDNIYQDVIDAEEKHNFQYFQQWQEQANEFARLILLFADRSSSVDAAENIFKAIRSQDGEGVVDEEMLNNFYLKKL